MGAVPEEYDTVVIGAGIAGLAAGRMLSDAGQKVAILDARSRIGGRIFTERANVAGSGDVPIELGAEFIHGLPAGTWDLVREGNLGTYELQGSQLFFIHNRVQKSDASHDAASEVLHGLKCWAQEHPASDMAFADYLTLAGIGGAAAQAAAAYVEGFNAADQGVIGAAALAKQQRAEDEIQGDRLFRVQGGYDRIPRVLARSLERNGASILLNHSVRAVTWSEGAVSIHTTAPTGRTLTARRAVITLPLAVLQAGSVEFSPPPAALMAQARRMRMGEVVRMSLVFRSRFWCGDDLLLARPDLAPELEHLSFLFTPGLTPATWWTPIPDQSPVITGWAGGPKAEIDRDALLMVSLRVLSAVFGISENSLRRELASWHSHDWSADVHSRGAYSYAPAGALDASEKMSIPVAGTLYFAGEHTDTTGHWGTVHGALGSGLRAARQVLRDCAPR